MNKKTVMLMILDGWGINENERSNAIKMANTPNYDKLVRMYPNTTIATSGEDVGLPEGQMGNSEVGHMNIGAGTIIYQESTRISKSIKDGDFFDNKALLQSIENCKKNNSSLHLFGLLSDGGVHSYNSHLYAILELCKKENFENVYIHVFTDGRDTPITSGETYIDELNNKIKEISVGRIVTVVGRYYAMDRDNRWDRVEVAYNALVNGVGILTNSIVTAVENSYQSEVFDEFIKPIILSENDEAVGRIKENDSIIFFNFRHDRAREITRAFVDKEFDKFDRKYVKTNYTCFTNYDESIENVNIAFDLQKPNNTFGEYISKKGLSQLRIAETEKYAHVTFFFNGGEERVFENEDRILIDSPKVATYDLKPEMSAYEVKDKAIEAIKEQKYDSIILNFANGDMVGHTGSLDAAIAAVEAVDKCIGEVYEAIESVNGVLLITADHGNAEQMVDYKTGEVHTAHTTNQVPLILVGCENVKLNPGRLCDLAPTMLELLEIEKPKEMEGISLIVK